MTDVDDLLSNLFGGPLDDPLGGLLSRKRKSYDDPTLAAMMRACEEVERHKDDETTKNSS